MNRGEIWWADLPEPVGSGPGFRRPVLIVQADSFNGSAISTVIVAVITSNLGLGAAPGNVTVKPAETGLQRPSVVNVSQVLTIDKSILSSRVKSAPPSVLERVNAGLRLVLALS